MQNQALLKADLAIADLSSGGGLLNDEQAARFIRKLIEQPTILRTLRVVEMSAPTRQINKIVMGKRILRPGTQGTSLDTAAVDGAFDPLAENAARAKPQFEQILLQTKEVIAEVRIPYDVMEDNIERGSIGAATDVGGAAFTGGIRDTIVDLIAERVAVDLEELCIQGNVDLVATDPYLGMLDGFLQIGEEDGNVVNHASAGINKDMFVAGLQTLPDQYHRGIPNMLHYVSVDKELDYRNTLADRGTAMGDNLIQGTSPVFGMGVRVMAVHLMPNARGILTDRRNLIMGIQRRVLMEFDKDIRTREYIIVVTARVAFEIEEPDAVVVYTNIG